MAIDLGHFTVVSKILVATFRLYSEKLLQATCLKAGKQNKTKKKHAKFLIWKAKPRLWLCNVTEKRGAGVGHSFCSSVH